MKKISAMTILELMVSLIVVSIVIVGSFWGYRMITQLYGKELRFNNDRVNELAMFTRFTRDFDSATNVRYSDDIVQLLVDSQDVAYKIFPDKLIRVGSNVDTTFVKIELENVQIDKGSAEVLSMQIAYETPFGAHGIELNREFIPIDLSQNEH